MSPAGLVSPPPHPRRPGSRDPAPQLATVGRAFKREACDLDALVGVLDTPDALATDDGGRVKALACPISGAELVAAFYARRLPGDLTLLERAVNGRVADIQEIWAILNPDKLRRWTTA